MESLASFTKEFPGFIAAKMPVNDVIDADMFEAESFQQEELDKAREAGTEAVSKAASGADKEAVRCQAYASTLFSFAKDKKRNSVLKGNIKASASRG